VPGLIDTKQQQKKHVSIFFTIFTKTDIKTTKKKIFGIAQKT